MPKKIEISHKTILFTLSVLGIAWLISRVIDIIILLFISFILMAAINPLIDRLQRFRLPRILAITLVYLLIWSSLGVIVATIIPALFDQTSRLVRTLPQAVSEVEFLNQYQQEITKEILSIVGSLPQNLLKVTIGVFSNLINVLTTLVITFYLLLDHKRLESSVEGWFGASRNTDLLDTIHDIETRLGSWLRGELVLMLSIGLLTYVGLLFLGVDNALPLAIIAGILEIVPNIGPIISAVPAILIALTIHPLTALATVAWYFIVQFLENNILVPKIMQKAVGVNPIVSILALMIGFRLSGPAGAILSLPLIITLQSIFLHFFARGKVLPGDE